MRHINTFLQLTKIKKPIIQAPMAGVTTPKLIAAVSNAGGLGSYGAGYDSPQKMSKVIHDIRQLTNKPFNVNLFIPSDQQPTDKEIQNSIEHLMPHYKALNLKPPAYKAIDNTLFEEQVAVLLEEKPPVFSFTFGMPDKKIITAFKQQGIIIIGTATTSMEAKQLDELGCDIITAQGVEAGGHRGTFATTDKNSAQIGSFALIPAIANKINKPIVAAGGINNGKGLLAALTLGASAVQIGTAFLATPESGASPLYKKTLKSCDDTSTQLTTVFTGRLARAIHTPFFDECRAILPYPAQHVLTQPLRKAAQDQKNTKYCSFWSGQKGIRSEAPYLNAAKLVDTIWREALEETAYLEELGKNIEDEFNFSK